MIMNWNVDKVIADCQKMHRGANDPYVTGWNNWPCKQDLYRVKFAVDEMLNNTSSFAGEAEWLEQQKIEHEKKQVWRSLNEVRNMP
jgi:hypothetical protein